MWGGDIVTLRCRVTRRSDRSKRIGGKGWATCQLSVREEERLPSMLFDRCETVLQLNLCRLISAVTPNLFFSGFPETPPKPQD